VENEQELLRFRAHAAYLLARYSTKNASDQNSSHNAMTYFQRSLDFCAAATTEERCRLVRAITPSAPTPSEACMGEETSVGEILDDMHQSSEREMEYKKNPMAFLKRSLANSPYGCR
jgi:hypothetical protein